MFNSLSKDNVTNSIFDSSAAQSRLDGYVKQLAQHFKDRRLTLHGFSFFCELFFFGRRGVFKLFGPLCFFRTLIISIDSQVGSCEDRSDVPIYY